MFPLYPFIRVPLPAAKTTEAGLESRDKALLLWARTAGRLRDGRRGRPSTAHFRLTRSGRAANVMTLHPRCKTPSWAARRCSRMHWADAADQHVCSACLLDRADDQGNAFIRFGQSLFQRLSAAGPHDDPPVLRHALRSSVPCAWRFSIGPVCVRQATPSSRRNAASRTHRKTRRRPGGTGGFRGRSKRPGQDGLRDAVVPTETPYPA